VDVSEFPAVCAVVPTRDRPELLARAVTAILDQDYPGTLEVAVVVDGTDVAAATSSLPDDARIRFLTNTRTSGLSGTRNTGILSATTPLVAFCDDDDEWLPGRLRRQVAALQDQPGAEFATCAIEVDYDGHRSVRRAGTDRIDYETLLPRRMAMLHSSTFLADRAALVSGIGLLDEQVPGSQNEDWDLLLRAARRHPIVNVDDPLVRVYWSKRSYFDRDWDTKASSSLWMLEQHPDIARSSRGAARVYAQIAFAKAASGARRDSWRWAGRSLRKSWREPRAYIALAVTAGLSADYVQGVLHERGHGV
jgi:glycosyltransferase involved in cell wall biosynthesis